MMAFLSLIFFGVLLIAATGVAWLAWSIVALCIARHRARKVLIGLPVSVVIVVVTVGCLWIYSTQPSVIFENEFAFPPPADVTFVNGSTFSLGDTGSTYLQFRASPATIARIVAAIGLQVGPPDFSTSGRPAWFRPNGQSWFRSTNPFASAPTTRGSFASEMCALTYDPSTRDAWHEFMGID